LLCGGGNNGGDGFVMARHLQNANVPVHVIVMADPAKIAGDAKTNFDVLRKMDTSIITAESSWTADDFLTAFGNVSDHPLIVDAMLGTGAKGSLRGPHSAAVEASNKMSSNRIAIDIPTGLDGDSGECEFAFKADVTFTFIARKTGFENPKAKHWLGDIEVIDIGAPREIFDRI
jgi:NAD(P)H-hydrate epimerase